MIRVLVADDEMLGRRAVCRLLAEDARFDVVAEASDGVDALAGLAEHRPDVAFLDLAMPGPGGLEVAARCSEPKPVIVFVTAHDRYALEAFQEAGLDYVLKPIDPERFRITLDRVVERIAAGRSVTAGAVLVTLQSAGRTVRFDANELISAQAQGNYVELCFAQSNERLRITMSRLMDLAQGARLVRVHRAFAVHLDQVRSLAATDGSHGAEVVLRSGTRLPVGRTYRSALKRALES